jgi:hypothetical protein
MVCSRVRLLSPFSVLTAAMTLLFVVPAGAGAAGLPNLSGAWTVTNKAGGSTGGDSYAFKLTSPGAYSISNAENFTALDVVVKRKGFGAMATSYWCGVPTATPAGCPANDALFVVQMNFRLPRTGHPTYTGTIVEYGSGVTGPRAVVQRWTTAATQTTGDCDVPNLKGDTLTAAQHAIAQAWCSLGTATQVKSGTVKIGHVVSQTPVGSKGPTVRLAISEGK